MYACVCVCVCVWATTSRLGNDRLPVHLFVFLMAYGRWELTQSNKNIFINDHRNSRAGREWSKRGREREGGVGASKTDATQLQWAPKGPLGAAPIASDLSASPASHCDTPGRQGGRQKQRHVLKCGNLSRLESLHCPHQVKQQNKRS